MNEVVEPADSGQSLADELDAIQPIGCLIALTDDWRISRVSANIGDFFETTPESIVGEPLTCLFSQAAIHSLRNRLALLRGPYATERLFSIPLTDEPPHYDVAIHLSGRDTIIDVEPNHDDHHDRETTGTVRGMIGQLGDAQSLDNFFEAAANQVRALTGFDRVTIHRFGASGGAELVAEVLRRGATAEMGEPSAYLGVHAPEPRNLVSFVADVAAVPEAIVRYKRGRSRPVDLSRSALRAASPTELELLRSAGIGAALAIAIVIEGRMWGQITCHHHAPCRPNFERRSALEWYAIMLAMLIEIRELKAKLES